jgi:site-specific recombinase XerD
MVLVPITSEVSGDYRAGVLSWERYLMAANKSPNTLRIYMTTVKALSAFLVSQGMPTRPDLITGEHVREYLAGIPTPATRRLRFQTLRTFFSYLVREGEITKSPMTNVAAPQVPDDEAGRTFVSPEALDKMLATCKRSRPPSYIDRRDLALLLLLRHSGLRRSEAAHLLLADIQPDDGELLVRKGKGAKDRRSMFTRDTSAALLRYIERRRDAMRGKPDHGMLFVSENGRSMTGDGIGAIVYRRAKLAGVGSVSAHELRHLFADTQKRAGMSDESLMDLGGWSDAKILGRYGRALRHERSREEYRRLNDK